MKILKKYKAQITGDGFYFDSGVSLPTIKTVCFEFLAENDNEAQQKAIQFSKSEKIKKEFWLTDENPKISVDRVVKGEHEEGRAYLI